MGGYTICEICDKKLIHCFCFDDDDDDDQINSSNQFMADLELLYRARFGHLIDQIENKNNRPEGRVERSHA